MGSVLFVGQFGLGGGDLLLGLCESGGGAADLRDEFVKGGAVHWVPSQSPLGDPDDCIAEKVNQMLTVTIGSGHLHTWPASGPLAACPRRTPVANRPARSKLVTDRDRC